MKTGMLCPMILLVSLGSGAALAQSGVNTLRSIPGLTPMSPVVKTNPASVVPNWSANQIAQLSAAFRAGGSKQALRPEGKEAQKLNRLEPLSAVRNFSLIGAKGATKTADVNRLAPIKGIGLFSGEKSKL
jgi:hypothetical protein